MKKELEKIFAQLVPIEPPAGLLEKVISQIQREKQILVLKRRITFFSFGLCGSLIAFMPVFKLVKIEILSSDFWQFLSLIFSDFGMVLQNWQDFGFALLERLPVLSVISGLLMIFAFYQFLRLLFWDYKKFQLMTKEA